MVSVFVGIIDMSTHLFIALQVQIKDFLPCSLPILKAIRRLCVCQCLCLTVCKHTSLSCINTVR